jgi:hypothetical protein
MTRQLALDISETPRPPAAHNGIRQPIVGDLAIRAVVAWTWQVFPAKPHASRSSQRLAGPERPVRAPAGDWLEPNQRRHQEIGEDQRGVLSLHVPADILMFENGSIFLNAALETINLAIIQCMPSHPNHDTQAKHVKRIRDRVTQFQDMESASVDLPQDNSPSLMNAMATLSRS